MAAMPNHLPHLLAAAQGFGLGLSLIVAIGAQNAFVLRQGLRREHLLPVLAFCALADALLVALGVFGAAWMGARLPWLSTGLAWGGALFLCAYGLRALWRSARAGASLQAAQQGAGSRGAALAQAAAFTLLNPHVYLDTVLLLGGVGAQQPPELQPAFVGGAALSSLLWFSALGFAALRLAPWLARPATWRALDAGMGLLLLGLGISLVRQA